ncbi:MAG: hypothetical protein MK086_14380 [Flavobacteriales bacterium]|nr:hypothetical protein [Flavobacteriales bacterium]
MVLGAIDCINFETIGIRIQGVDPEFTGQINMTKSMEVDSCFPFFRYAILELDTSILSEQLLAGSITFNELTPRFVGDSPYGSISGTFKFDLIDTLTDTLRFTEGRFRFDVPQIF